MKKYFEVFGKERVKVVVLEEFMREAQTVMRDILEFLEVDPNYPIELDKQYNSSNPPKVKWLNHFLFVIVSKSPLLRMLKRMIPRLIRMSIKQLIRKKNSVRICMKENTRGALMEYFADDIDKAARLTGKDLTIWG